MPWQITAGGPSPFGDQSKHLAKRKMPEWEAANEAWCVEARAAGKATGHKDYLHELYDSAPITMTERLPKVIYWWKRGRLKDSINFWDHFVISGKVRELIEELDPGVHEFFPVDLINKNTREKWPEPFWFLHICHILDSVIDELSGIVRSKYGRGHWAPSVQNDASLWSEAKGDLVFDAAAIKGNHVWRDIGNLNRFFASDRFVEELEARGIEGIGAIQHYKSV